MDAGPHLLAGEFAVRIAPGVAVCQPGTGNLCLRRFCCFCLCRRLDGWKGGLIEGFEAICKDSPLFPCALAELVPSVEHHAAADGEERGGLEASGGQVALRWEVEKSANTLSSLQIYVCWKAFPGTGGFKSAASPNCSPPPCALDTGPDPVGSAEPFVALRPPSVPLPRWVDALGIAPPAAMYSPSRHRCRQQLGASQPPLGVPRPPKPKGSVAATFAVLGSRLVQWHRMQCPVACSSSH